MHFEVSRIEKDPLVFPLLLIFLRKSLCILCWKVYLNIVSPPLKDQRDLLFLQPLHLNRCSIALNQNDAKQSSFTRQIIRLRRPKATKLDSVFHAKTRQSPGQTQTQQSDFY